MGKKLLLLLFSVCLIIIIIKVSRLEIILITSYTILLKYTPLDPPMKNYFFTNLVLITTSSYLSKSIFICQSRFLLICQNLYSSVHDNLVKVSSFCENLYNQSVKIFTYQCASILNLLSTIT